MILSNMVAWSIQIAMVVAAAALASALLRFWEPRARLFYWQLVLLASLALPLVRPWKAQPIAPDVSVSTVLLASQPTPPAHHFPAPREAALWLVAAGIATRLMWLGAGLLRLRRHRHFGRPLGSREGAALLLSDAVTSPVTFGVLRPVVLLPARFPEFEPAVREAILCHELLHVRRRDWLFVVAEELVRAAFWFHPAVWWVLGEIGLAREQEVDRRVVAATRTRDQYVDALLAIAGAGRHLDLAPAPLFLRKRHLKRRVVSLLKEVRMSKTRLVSSLAGALAVLAAACWMATATFPLSAAAESVADSPGVQVDIGSAVLLHRAPVVYPEAAREPGVQGTVVLQAVLDSRGNVTEAQVLSGPEELRTAALVSVLQWHFAADGGGRTRQVGITFQPAHAAAPRPAPPSAPLPEFAGLVVSRISVSGLSDSARTGLLSRLPVHAGDTLAISDIQRITAAAAGFDQHLGVTFRTPMGGTVTNLQSAREVWIDIAPDAPGAPPLRLVQQGTRLRVGGNLQSTKLISKPVPVYPASAKQARIQGVVKLLAQISKDGTVEVLTVISGHPLLVQAATDAVKQWVYETTLLNGAPVAVETEIDVNFTLVQ